MNVICRYNKSCSNIYCRHKHKHRHYDMCDVECDKIDIYGVTCIKTINEERKEKIKKLNESRRNL
jgi:hypothetical protein